MAFRKRRTFGKKRFSKSFKRRGKRGKFGNKRKRSYTMSRGGIRL